MEMMRTRDSRQKRWKAEEGALYIISCLLDDFYDAMMTNDTGPGYRIL
jgi:hypothetical protein